AQLFPLREPAPPRVRGHQREAERRRPGEPGGGAPFSRDAHAGRGGRGRPAPEATPPLRAAQAARPPVRPDRPQLAVLARQRAGPCVPGFEEDSARPQWPRIADDGERAMTTTKHPSCRAIELDLVATATGDVESRSTDLVQRHLATCEPCREEFDRYRAVDHVARGLRTAPSAEAVASSRAGLESRLADLRQRRVAYRIFPSPLGQILIGRSEHGIALVEYLGTGTSLRASRLGRVEGVEAVAGGPELERLERDLLDYIQGRRRDLDWSLDW